MTATTPPARIAVTGHRGLSAGTAGLVDSGIRAVLQAAPRPLVGITCLADGADQIFARAVLDAGGELHVVVPARRYRDGLPRESRAGYDALIDRAAEVTRLPYAESTGAAHMAGNRAMLGEADLLVAVWDGRPARGYGGTADVVGLAHGPGIPVRIVWPVGARRD